MLLLCQKSDSTTLVHAEAIKANLLRQTKVAVYIQFLQNWQNHVFSHDWTHTDVDMWHIITNKPRCSCPTKIKSRDWNLPSHDWQVITQTYWVITTLKLLWGFSPMLLKIDVLCNHSSKAGLCCKLKSDDKDAKSWHLMIKTTKTLPFFVWLNFVPSYYLNIKWKSQWSKNTK